MTFQALQAGSQLVSEPTGYYSMDDVSEAIRREEALGIPHDEGLSHEFDELDRDAFGGALG